ncbi:MAG TPA: 50S ribosomal protein L24 [Thermoanaerobaculales bacterium]|nr:50S ribosomal protein L24 [Thermoanaerobaculales bacterium]HPA80745.1 50S ribosomal protein L24 [Thermoanaerobaculales bacterium]
MKIKKGDTVEVISGKDAGKRGRVLVVDPGKQRVVIEGVHMIKRHTRPNPQRRVQGGIVEREAPVHVSNVMVISPDSGKPTRIGYKILEDGRKVRVAKTDGAILDR